MEKAFSLRKKRVERPKISAPRQISGPVPASVTSSLSVPQRPSLGGPSSSTSSLTSTRRGSPAGTGTADYVKRRYSSRINVVPNGFDAPAIPSLPSQYSQSSVPKSTSQSNGLGTTSAIVEIDPRALQDPNLEAEQYVSQILANASEHDIRDYQRKLENMKHRNSADLQHNVYQNRNQFIKISQEAEKLKGEMRALRNLMSDLTSTLGQTNAALGISTDTSTARKYANRSSVANLEAMWSTHLQELWRRVEGSQKFLPAVLGRHVIHESGRWNELNTASWKPRRRVHLILLNDHLLVACEKKRQELPSPTMDGQKSKVPMARMQLVAEKCWPLQDVEIVDLAARPGQSRQSQQQTPLNAINVRVGLESLTYATRDPNSPEKGAFLAKFRKAYADLLRTLQGEFEERSNAQNPARPTSREGLPKRNPSLSFDVRAKSCVDAEGRQQDFHAIETQVDEFENWIAMQKFEDAVNRVERLRRVVKNNKSNQLVQDLNDSRIVPKTSQLAEAILRQMIDTNSFIGATMERVSWLTKLGFEARASEAYLEARTAVIKVRISQCADLGDLHQYMYQASFIYFTLIRNTVNIYQNCFAPAMTSACIKWAKEHIEGFNLILARQMKRLEPGNEQWKYCLSDAREKAGILLEVGIDFRSLIGSEYGDGSIK